jgi:hypothetical protein
LTRAIGKKYQQISKINKEEKIERNERNEKTLDNILKN